MDEVLVKNQASLGFWAGSRARSLTLRSGFSVTASKTRLGSLAASSRRRRPDDGQDVLDVLPDDLLVLDEVGAVGVDLAQRDDLLLGGLADLVAEVLHQAGEGLAARRPRR